MVFKIRVLKNKFLQDFNFDNSFVKMNFKEIQILISWISFSTILLRFAKLFSSWSFLRALGLTRGRSLFLRTVFSNPFSAEFPYTEHKERKSKDIFTRRSNSCFDFAFSCKFEIPISKSKSRFPNRSCLMSSKNT